MQRICWSLLSLPTRIWVLFPVVLQIEIIKRAVNAR